VDTRHTCTTLEERDFHDTPSQAPDDRGVSSARTPKRILAWRVLYSQPMDLAVFPPQELPTALGAVRALQPGSSALRDRFLRVLATLHGVAIDLTLLPTPSFAETAAVITDPHRRKRLVQLAVVSSLLGGDTAAPERAIAQLAEALDVDDGAIRAGRAIESSTRRAPTAIAGGVSHEALRTLVRGAADRCVRTLLERESTAR